MKLDARATHESKILSLQEVIQEQGKALLRLYKIVQHEMKDWQLDEPAKDELRDALKEAKKVIYS